MKLLPYFKWIAGSMSDFVNQFNDNETLYNQARTFWNHLENASWVFPVILFVAGIGWAFIYYKPYNEQPHRHYHPKYWFLFFLITFASAFFITWGYEYFAVPPKLKGANMLEVKFALGNAIYTVLLFVLTSFFWCNLFPTNAYRFLKL